MAITSFTIDGVEVDPLLETFEIRETTGDISTMVCDVESSGSPVFRIPLRSEVIVQEDGVRIFAGTVTQTRERGHGGPNLYDAGGAPEIITSITAEDYARIADRVYATTTVADGTLLKDALTALVTDYLSGLGISLHASQVNGPALPAMAFTRVRASEVLTAFSDATGYLSRVDYDKKLRMWAPGDIAAPFNIDEFDDPPKWTDDVEVEAILGDTYANRVIVTSDLITEYSHVETFVEGVDTYPYQLEYTMFANRGYVTCDTIFETLRTPDDPDAASWTYDPATNTITRDAGEPAAGIITSINFDGTFTAYAVAEDAAAIALYGLYEYVEPPRNDITTNAAAQTLANSILAEHLTAGDQIVTYPTRYSAPSLRAGQQQSITATARDLSGNYIISEMTVRGEVTESGVGFLRTITTKRNQVLSGKWQQTYKDWLRAGGEGTNAAATTVGSGGTTTGGPAPPLLSVQFNENGAFGGRTEFTFNPDTDSVICGGGGSSITAVSPSSCQVFGLNNHIADP